MDKFLTISYYAERIGINFGAQGQTKSNCPEKLDHVKQYFSLQQRSFLYRYADGLQLPLTSSVESVGKVIFCKFAINKINNLRVRKYPKSGFFYRLVSCNACVELNSFHH